MVLRGGVTVVQYPESPCSGGAGSPSAASGSSGSEMRQANAEPTDGVPAFVAKLWKLVDEARTDQLICWGSGGNTFIIKNQIDFARKLLPLYYKHNNMASFIRQLNMYGFHKVVSVEDGSLKCDNEEIQFSHPCFLRGHVYMLQHIKRKIATSRTSAINSGEEKALFKPEVMTKVLTDVKHMKGRQENLDARFSVMKRENEALWREVALLRQKHIKQQQIVNNLIQFLMSLVQPSRNGPLKTGMKRRYQLMIDDAAHNSTDNVVNEDAKRAARFDAENVLDDEENDFVLPDMIDVDGPTIHEVGDQEHFTDILDNTASNSGGPKAKSKKMSASSLISDSIDLNAGIIAGEEVPVENVLESINSIEVDDDNIQLFSENTDIPILIQPNQIKQEIVTKGKGKKNSGKKTKKQALPHVSPFLLNSTEASPTLPSNIFDSDEANSQDETFLTEDPDAMLSNTIQNLSEEELISPSGALDNINIMNSVSTGNYNPNLSISSSKNKSKIKKQKSQNDNLLQIKEEIVFPDENVEDVNDMTVATLPNENIRPTLNRFNSVEDVDDHLQTMQSDIDSLREILCGDYSLDANTLLGQLFEQEDPFYGLSMNPSDAVVEKDKEIETNSTNQMISYFPQMPNLGFEDLEMENDSDSQKSMDNTASSNPTEDSSLNTPQVQLSELKFPNDSID